MYKRQVITGTGLINGNKSVICVMDSHFMMWSMGTCLLYTSFVKEISRGKKIKVNIFNVEDLTSLNKTLEGVETKC